ncbi:ero1-like protein [Ctenocephalides felis]|uniref:ero1-like protein n=1 Tax=Ctenocephalides felis TaxID=7515 RepID=UPI000E6E2741|nr:ero1-like protein [Ctenocephalides felis]
MSHCHVEACQQEDIPAGLKRMKQRYQDPDQSQTFCDDFDTRLGYLNMSISPAAHKGFEEWAKHDDAQDNFCLLDEDEPSAQYVDLLLNPERYTGYKGFSANRIWRSIYMENCFRPKNCMNYNSFIPYNALSAQNGMCLEKRAFYRVLSGLHTSINIHLCANYLLSDKEQPGFVGPTTGLWGPNIEEFRHRFHPDYTNGEGPHWLRNLYFIYLVELRALSKAAPYLLREEYFTGNESEDKDVKAAITDLLKVVQSFPTPFNERTMFNGHTTKLKREFQHHFQNISRIMDCVGCDKCKLWGKLQVQGLGTALKILFSGKFDSFDEYGIDLVTLGRSKFQLQRTEIVSLFNAFGRLSTSINELETFRTIKKKR